MDANKLKEILYAYSAGCLDAEDYPHLAKYLNSGSGMFARELSDLQNIIALIPAILEIEQPNPKVKDKVARKLYRMREEARTAKKPLAEENPLITEKSDGPSAVYLENHEISGSTKKEMSPSYVPLSKPAASEPETADEDISANTLQFETRQDNSNKNQDIPVEDARSSIVNENQLKPEFDLSQYEITTPQELNINESGSEKTHIANSPKFFFYTAVNLVITLALCAGLYFYMSKDISRNKDQINALIGQVSSLNEEIVKLEKNQRVLTLLGAKDTRSYNLDATEANPKGFGKLTISSEGKEGVLQLYNMPSLTGNQVYQLWVTNGSQAISMGAFRMKRDVEYFSVDQLPMDQSQIVSFIVTLEENGGSAVPSKNTFLSSGTAEKK